MQRILITHDFTQPPERVFAYLAEHEHLEKVFPAKIERLSDGTDGTRNGVGSSRKMRIGGVLPPFVETVTDVDPDRRIAYRITKGGPLKDHRGELRFAPLDAGGTHLEWEISFGAKVPGLDVVVAKGLERSVRKGMQTVAREA